ncbi:MAG: DMT family transporter [Alphaproteobacteria bacterium]|nr:DMT family transporter [Alphaproteobacteria bacterium]
MPKTVRGPLLMLIAALGFAAMHGTIRHVSRDLHPFEIAFFRNFFGFIVFLPVLYRAGFGILKTTKMPLYIGRGVLNAAAMLMFFTALSLIPLAQVTALSFTAPLFGTLGAALILGEVVRIRRWTALIIGFTGMLVIIRPGIIDVSTGALLTVISSMLWACALLMVKRLSETESSLAISAYMVIILMPITLLAAIPFWAWPTWENLFWLLLVGLFGSISHVSLTESFKHADASAVLPLDFTKLIWASLIGYLFFMEVPDLWTLVGGVMIAGGAIYIGVREARLKKQAAEVKPAS